MWAKYATPPFTCWASEVAPEKNWSTNQNPSTTTAGSEISEKMKNTGTSDSTRRRGNITR